MFPLTKTMLGALYRYLREADPKHFQPMNANFGLLAPLGSVPREKAKKKAQLAERAMGEMAVFVRAIEAG